MASTTVDIRMVAAALDCCSSAGVAGTAKMLAAGLRHAATTPVGERHPFQGQLLDMVRGALQEGEQAAEREGEAADEKVQQAKQALANEEISVKAASNAELEASKVVSDAEEAAASKKAEEKKARAATLDPEKLKQKLLSRKEQVKQEYEQATNVAEGSLNMLCQGGWEDDEVREAVLAAVSDLLKSSSAEATLVAAMPAAFTKKPEDRQEFDKIIENEVVRVITSERNKRQAALLDSEQEAEDANAEALGLQVLAEFAEEAAAAANADVASAKEALNLANEQRVNAEEAVAGRQQGIEALCSEKEAILEKVAQVREAMTSLERLVAGVSASAEGATVDVDMEDATEQKENCPVDGNSKPTSCGEALKTADNSLQEAVMMVA